MSKSPSISIRETDASSYTTTNSNTTLAIVGFATKGPVGKAKLITSKSEFIETYGEVPADSPFGNLAAYKAFNYTNKIIYYRVATGDEAAEHVIRNTKPASAAYAEFASKNSEIYLDGEKDYGFNLKVGADTVDDIIFSPDEDGYFTLSEVVEEINLVLGEKATAELGANNKIIIKAVNPTDVLGIEAPAAGTISLLDENLLGAVDVHKSEAEVVAGKTDAVLIKSIQTGSSTNKITLVKTSEVDPTDTTKTYHNFSVLYNGSQVETFENLSLTPNDEKYFLNVISRDGDNGGSEWIEFDVSQVSDNDKEIVFPNGEYKLGEGNAEFNPDTDTEWDGANISYDFKVGTDGIPKGSSSYLFVSALGIEQDLGNAELFNFDILITPDNGTASVQDAAQTLAEARQDFIYLADPPEGLDYKQVVAWHNGDSSQRKTAFNSSYVAAYWSWMKEYNVASKEYTWVPPSVYIAALYLKTDLNSRPWSAPAGERRGRIITSDIEHSPSFAEREELYGGLNAVNPIVEFSSKGIIVYGQKTTLRENSAVNRVNVRRLLIYIKKLIKSATEGLIFEPHTPESWGRGAKAITDILETVKSQGGLEDYVVNVNANTNAPNLVAQGVMRGNIILVPTGTIERIELDVKFLSPGAIITE